MEIIEKALNGILLIKPQIFHDERGFFFEAMNIDKLAKIGIKDLIYQENQAFSYKGALRGLHFQKPPFEQGKLVRAIKGEIVDVAVDIRKGSPTFGKHYKTPLSENNQYQIWIPPGFAHGALTISDTSIMAYYCTNRYSRNHAYNLLYSDPDLAIDWELDSFILTDLDRNAPRLKDIDTGFYYTEQ